MKSIAEKYHWTAHESICEGLQRIAREQLQLAIAALVPIGKLPNSKASLDEAVHEARKSVKKTRSPLRDSQALIEIFDQLTAKYREELGARSLVSVREGLVTRKKELHRSFQRQRVSGKVLKSLRKLAAGVEKWDLHIESICNHDPAESQSLP